MTMLSSAISGRLLPTPIKNTCNKKRRLHYEELDEEVADEKLCL